MDDIMHAEQWDHEEVRTTIHIIARSDWPAALVSRAGASHEFLS
jgi:hypothetical protein